MIGSLFLDERDALNKAKLESLRVAIARARDKHWPHPKEAEHVSEIFHYCDTGALHGILTSKSLWASEIFGLNDASEVDYARQATCEALSAFSELSPVREKFLDERLFLETYRGWNTYVCCFSAGGDLLSQWRAYGAQGNGYAIGFNPAVLKKEGDTSPPKLSVFPMLYPRDQQVCTLRDFLAETMQIEGLRDLLRSHPQETFLEIAMALLIMMAPLKNPLFDDEREWRIMIVEDEPDSQYKLFFRPIRGAIVPYVKVPLKPECFTRIVQGPTTHKEFGERSLQLFLRQNGLGHINVESSGIPLRSL